MTVLIQNSMFVAGLITLLQLYPILKVGAKLPIVMGTSSGFIAVCKNIAMTGGYGAVIGASIVGGIFEMILGFFIKPLRKLFPPVVTSSVILSIGLSLLPIGAKYFAGGEGSELYGTWQSFLVGTIVLVTVVILKQFTKGFLNVSSILIGINLCVYLAKLIKSSLKSLPKFLFNISTTSFSVHISLFVITIPPIK